MEKFVIKLILGCSLVAMVLGGTPLWDIPPTSPTRHQFIAGIGVPLNLEHEAITYGWTMKAQYFLPETVEQLKFQFFPGIFGGNYTNTFLFDTKWHQFPNGRRRRDVAVDPLSGQKYEKYDVEVEEVANEPLSNAIDDDDFDDQFEEDKIDKKMIEEWRKNEAKNNFNDDVENGPELESSRWEIYDAFGATLEGKGFNGHFCMLRAICEAANTEFSHETLMGELFHVFFSPSTTTDAIRKSSDYDYFKAEMIGREKSHEECGKAFHQCETSILEVFTQIFDDFLNV